MNPHWPYPYYPYQPWYNPYGPYNPYNPWRVNPWGFDFDIHFPLFKDKAKEGMHATGDAPPCTGTDCCKCLCDLVSAYNDLKGHNPEEAAKVREAIELESKCLLDCCPVPTPESKP